MSVDCEAGVWMDNGRRMRTATASRETGWLLRRSDSLTSQSGKPSLPKAAEAVGWVRVARSAVPGARLPEAESQLHPSLIVRPWASPSTSQGLRWLLCKMLVTGTKVSSQRVLWALNKKRWAKCLDSAWLLAHATLRRRWWLFLHHHHYYSRETWQYFHDPAQNNKNLNSRGPWGKVENWRKKTVLKSIIEIC